jgi:hypothetical protein
MTGYHGRNPCFLGASRGRYRGPFLGNKVKIIHKHPLGTHHREDRQGRVLAILKPNKIIRKCTDANCNSFHLRVFLGLLNPQGQRQTSSVSILCDIFGERKAKFNLETSRTTQMQLYKCIHIP